VTTDHRGLHPKPLGVVPSVALAWKINEEGFIKNIGAISDLKLRLDTGLPANRK
jgi:hypothetical protein